MEPEKDMLVRLARALEPARDRFVVVGGAAHQLFRLFELAQAVEFPVLRTMDADVVADTRRAPGPLRLDRRLEDFGFRAVPSGDSTPPSTRYELASDPRRYVQFLAPRPGNGLRRDGTRMYIHDTLRLFASSLIPLRELWQSISRSRRSVARSVARGASKLADSVDDDIRRADLLMRSLGRPAAQGDEGLVRLFAKELAPLFARA